MASRVAVRRAGRLVARPGLVVRAASSSAGRARAPVDDVTPHTRSHRAGQPLSYGRFVEANRSATRSERRAAISRFYASFDDIDANRDGRLSQAEAHAAGMPRELFGAIEKNADADGSISKGDYGRWLAAGGDDDWLNEAAPPLTGRASHPRGRPSTNLGAPAPLANAAPSYGAFLAERHDAAVAPSRAERRQAVAAFFEATRGPADDCAVDPNPRPAAVQPRREQASFSYARFLAENPWSSRAERRAAVAHFLARSRSVDPTPPALKAPQPDAAHKKHAVVPRSSVDELAYGSG